MSTQPRPPLDNWFTANAPDAIATPDRADIEQRVISEARSQGVDEHLARAIGKNESSFRPSVTSSVGAQGVMQLMPGTARDMGVSDSMNADENIRGGVRYLKQLQDKYGEDWTKIAQAYHAGPANLDAGKIGPQTKAYVSKVLADRSVFAKQKPKSNWFAENAPDAPDTAPAAENWFAQNAPDASNDTAQFDTKLSPQEEQQFQAWKKINAPNDSGEDYDLRGLFKSGDANRDERGHSSDKFKKPNHPTFSTESQYHGVGGNVGGQWQERDGKTYFIPSATNLRGRSLEDLKAYFKENEPNVILSQAAQRANTQGLQAPASPEGWTAAHTDRLRQLNQEIDAFEEALKPRAADIEADRERLKESQDQIHIKAFNDDINSYNESLGQLQGMIRERNEFGKNATLPGTEAFGGQMPGVPGPPITPQLQPAGQPFKSSGNLATDMARVMPDIQREAERRGITRFGSYAQGAAPGQPSVGEMLDVGILLGSMGLGEAAQAATSPIAKRALAALTTAAGGYFAYGMGKAALDSLQKSVDAFKKGDYADVIRQLGTGAVAGKFAYEGGKAAVRGAVIFDPNYAAEQASRPPSERDLGSKGATRGPIEPEIVNPEAKAPGPAKPTAALNPETPPIDVTANAEPVAADNEALAPGQTFETEKGKITLRRVTKGKAYTDLETPDGKVSRVIQTEEEFRRTVGLPPKAETEKQEVAAQPPPEGVSLGDGYTLLPKEEESASLTDSAEPLVKENTAEPGATQAEAEKPAAIGSISDRKLAAAYKAIDTPETREYTPEAIYSEIIRRKLPLDQFPGLFAKPEAAKEAKEAKEAKPESEKHEFSSTQVNLPKELSLDVRNFGASIPEKELAADGREPQPHITVKYGLHGDSADEVRKLLADEPPITVTLGKASIFPAKEASTQRGGDQYDVVKVDIDSPDLHRLNKKIAGALPHTDTHPKYQPHATIAYVKPGEGQKYVGQEIPNVTGKTVTLKSIQFSSKSGEVVEIPLKGETKPPATETKPAKTETTAPKPNSVVELPVQSISVDPARFQFKADTGQSGAGEELRDLEKFDPVQGGVVLVWHDPADGKTYIVNGHNRLALAARTGTEKILARYIDADNAQEARAIGALVNIGEGRGTSLDAAKLFRDRGINEAGLAEHNIAIKGEKAREGMALSKLDPHLFGQVVSGEIPAARAAVIGAGLPEHADQRALYDVIKARDKAGKRLSNDQIEEMIRLAKSGPQKTEAQVSLFGAEEVKRSLIAEKAEVSDYVRKQLASEKRLFGSVGSEAVAGKLGERGNVIKAGENRAIADQAAQALAIYEKLSERSGAVSDVLGGAASDLAEGKDGTKTKQLAYARIRQAIAREIPSVSQKGVESVEGHGSQGPVQAGQGQRSPEVSPGKLKEEPQADFSRRAGAVIAEATAQRRPVAVYRPGVKGRAGTVYVNQAGLRLLNDVVGAQVGAMRLPAASVTQVRGVLKDFEHQARNQGHYNYAAGIDSVRTALLESQEDTPLGAAMVVPIGQSQPLEITKALVRHEQFHQTQRGFAPKNRDHIDAEKFFSENRLAQHASGALMARGYPDNPDLLALEIGAHLAAGQFEDLGLSPEQAAKLWDSYIDALVEMHGANVLANIMRVTPKLNGALRDARQRAVNRFEEARARRQLPRQAEAVARSSSQEESGVAARIDRANPEIKAQGFNNKEVTPQGDLFGDSFDTEAQKKAEESGKNKLEADRLTAEFNSQMSGRGKRLKKPEKKQTDLFEETPEEEQGSLFHRRKLTPEEKRDQLSLEMLPHRGVIDEEAELRARLHAAGEILMHSDVSLEPAVVDRPQPEAGTRHFAAFGSTGEIVGEVSKDEYVNWESRVFPEGPSVGASAKHFYRVEFPKGALEPASRKGTAAEDQGVLFSRKAAPTGPIWYSQLQRAIEEKMPARASAAQIESIVRNPQNAIKADELVWTGFLDFLREQKGPIARETALEFLKANEVEVQEIDKSNTGEKEREKLQQRARDLGRQWATVNSEIQRHEHFAGAGGSAVREKLDKLVEIEREQAEIGQRVNRLGTATKFEGHALPGGRDYHELLLTLPSRRDALKWTLDEYAEYQKLASFIRGDHDRVASPEQRRRFEELKNRQEKANTADYKSPHWDEPNVLAHVRFDDRETADGKKTLMVQEIQSDWGQAGRKKGFKGDFERSLTPEERELRDLNRKTWQEDRQLTEAEKARAEELQKRVGVSLLEKADKFPGFIPDMPFAKNWQELAFRRILRHAAENGYDSLSWTTGATQAERYDLSKHIDRLNIVKSTVRDSWDIEAYKGVPRVLEKTANSPEELEELVGKDLARRIISYPEPTKPFTLSGLDLKVGGGGMRGFYDSILPAYANKFGKKFGAKVETAELKSSGKDARVLDTILRQDFGTDWGSATEEQRQQAIAIQEGKAKPKPITAHSLPITDSMRESVLAGQPLFALGKPRASSGVPSSHQILPRAIYRKGVLWTNSETTNMLADLAGGSRSTSYHGFYLSGIGAQKLMNKLDSLPSASPIRQGIFDVLAGPLKKAVREAISRNGGLIVVTYDKGDPLENLKATLRHEKFHEVTKEMGGYSRGGILLTHPLAQQAAKNLGKKGYEKKDAAEMFSEIGAHLASGPVGWREMGLDRAQAKVLFKRYLELLDKSTIAKMRSIAPQLREVIYGYNTEADLRADGDSARRDLEGLAGERDLRRGLRAGVSGDGELRGNRKSERDDEKLTVAERLKRLPGEESGQIEFTTLGNKLTQIFGDEDAPKVDYSKLGAAKRLFLPGRNLAEVEEASRPVFEAALPAASADALASTTLQSVSPAIMRTLSGSGFNFPELRLYYVESRLRGVRDRWTRFSQEADDMSPEQMESNMEALPDGSPSPYLDLLDKVEGRHGMAQNLSQTAVALAQQEDWDTLKTFLAIAFEDAADRVATVMPADQFDAIHGAVRTNPKVREADRLYGEIEKVMADAHAVNEGIFSTDLGPAGRYYPLIPTNIEQKSGPGRRLAYHKPRNTANAFATGLSEDYDTGMEAFSKKLSSGVRSNYKANLIETMRQQGWLIPESQASRNAEGKFVMTGPDGVEYVAAREETKQARTIMKDGKVIHMPARFGVMPAFMNAGLRATLDREPMDPNAVINAMRWANMLATKGPLELAYHSAGVLGALYANTPFLGGSGLDKALSLPLMKWFSIRGKLLNIDPTQPENIVKLREMATAGALPAKSGKITYSKEYAEMTGAERERFSFGPMLYGPKGIDARARILMYDIFKAAYPNGTTSEMHHFVNQIGNYTPELQGIIERGLKQIGLGPFATAGMTRIVNAVQTFTGGGPGKGGTLESKIWWWLTSSAIIGLAAWIIAHKVLTGKYPTQRKQSALMDIAVVPGGGGYIDKARYTKFGKGMWGTGPEVGHLKFSFFDNPLVLRGAHAMGLAGAYQTKQLGGSPGQIMEAAELDITNSLAHPAMGPAARAAFVLKTGEKPYLTGMHDRGRVALRMFPAIPPKTKPGLPSVRSRAWAGMKELNSFYADAAENLAGMTGFTDPDQHAKGSFWMKLPFTIVTPGLIGEANSPYKKAEMLRQERAAH